MRPRHGLIAPVPLVALLAILGATPGLAGTLVDPTAESVSLAAMLQPSDVHRSATSGGVSVGGSDDLAGFTSNGGLREVRQTLSSESPAETVFDFRWQFPDADAAEAFLDAAETALSEVEGGAQRATLPRAQRPLPGTRLYTFEDRLFGTGVVGFNYLMREENLVAKVYVSGHKDKLSQNAATKIARAAANRIKAALAGAEPVVSPLPDVSPSPSPSASPEATPSASADAGDADAELLSHVPAALRTACESAAPDGADAGNGRLARATCTGPGGGVVTFVLFDTAESMDAAYDTGRDYTRIFGSFRTGDSCESGGYDGSWSLVEVEAGRLLCQELGGAATILWSHPATRILSLIREEGADFSAAWDLWLAAGPE